MSKCKKILIFTIVCIVTIVIYYIIFFSVKPRNENYKSLDNKDKLQIKEEFREHLLRDDFVYLEDIDGPLFGDEVGKILFKSIVLPFYWGVSDEGFPFQWKDSSYFGFDSTSIIQIKNDQIDVTNLELYDSIWIETTYGIFKYGVVSIDHGYLNNSDGFIYNNSDGELLTELDSDSEQLVLCVENSDFYVVIKALLVDGTTIISSE